MDTKHDYYDQDQEVASYFMMGSPWPVLAIVGGYLYFVLKWGPEYMKDRKSFNIKYLMLIYNLYQTIWNANIVAMLFTTEGAISYLWKHCCHPAVTNPSKLPLEVSLIHSAWLYFFSKVMDLFDTVFFVLRKKQSHISFLHVYHHSNMVLSTWAYMKYIRGEQGVIVGFVNALVHVFMYAYYFFAALGPGTHKYLWWKRYITKMQMTQFVLIISYMTGLLLAKCELPKAFSAYIIFQGLVFLVLFANFYINTYIRVKSDSESSKHQLRSNGSLSNGSMPKDISQPCSGISGTHLPLTKLKGS